jgi:predicted transcriptional regulator
MKVGIKVKEVMKKEFPIVDINQSLAACTTRLAKNSACLVIDKGNFIGILKQEEILKGFLNAKEKIRDLNLMKKISIIDSESDIIELLDLIRTGNEFILLKEHNNIIGIVTKDCLRKAKSSILGRIRKKFMQEARM